MAALYRLVEDDSSNLGETAYYEINGRLPTFKVSPLIEGRSEQFGVYQMKIDRKTVAVLDFAIPGGLITFGNQPAIAMGLFMDYAAVNREYVCLFPILFFSRSLLLLWRVTDVDDDDDFVRT